MALSRIGEIMGNELLSIGDMARLKDVSVKALRYYERIGALAPAYVNPQTGYRYYSLAQSSVLDVITSCVELGIPLKELADYQLDGGALDMEALLTRGHALALEKLKRARKTLLQMESYREGMHVRDEVARTLGGRTLALSSWNASCFDTRRYAKEAAALYSQANENGFVPLYLQGMLWLPENESWHVAVEVTKLDEKEGAAERTGAAGSEGADGRTGAAGSESAADETSASSEKKMPSGTKCEPKGTSLFRMPEATYRTRTIEGPDFESRFQRVFAETRNLEKAALPAFAVEVWGAEFRPDRIVIDLITAEGR